MMRSRGQINLAPDAHSPTVYVVEDDASFRVAIGDLLRACNNREAPLSGGPACIFLDIRMAGCSGPQLQRRLVDLGSRVPVIFVTGYGDIPTAVEVIKCGAEDMLTKSISKQRLLDAIEHALAHGEQMRDRERRTADLRALVSRLTAREHEVLVLLARGKPHKQIAYALGTSERTVKYHRHNILQKCGAHSLADLAIIADRLGMLAATAQTHCYDRARLAQTAVAAPRRRSQRPQQ